MHREMSLRCAGIQPHVARAGAVCMKAAVLLPAILLAAGMAGAQDYLNCHFAPGWEPSGAKRDYVFDNLYDYKDGGAEGYLIFGFVRMRGITCASGGNTLDIDVSQMTDADAAYRSEERRVGKKGKNRHGL